MDNLITAEVNLNLTWRTRQMTDLQSKYSMFTSYSLFRLGWWLYL